MRRRRDFKFHRSKSVLSHHCREQFLEPVRCLYLAIDKYQDSAGANKFLFFPLNLKLTHISAQKQKRVAVMLIRLVYIFQASIKVLVRIQRLKDHTTVVNIKVLGFISARSSWKHWFLFRSSDHEASQKAYDAQQTMYNIFCSFRFQICNLPKAESITTMKNGRKMFLPVSKCSSKKGALWSRSEELLSIHQKSNVSYQLRFPKNNRILTVQESFLRSTCANLVSDLAIEIYRWFDENAIQIFALHFILLGMSRAFKNCSETLLNLNV